MNPQPGPPGVGAGRDQQPTSRLPLRLVNRERKCPPRHSGNEEPEQVEKQLRLVAGGVGFEHEPGIEYLPRRTDQVANPPPRTGATREHRSGQRKLLGVACIDHQVISLPPERADQVDEPQSILDQVSLVEEDDPIDARITLDEIRRHPGQEHVHLHAGPGAVQGVEKRQEQHEVADAIIRPDDEDPGRRRPRINRQKPPPGDEPERREENSLAELFPMTGHAVIGSPDPNDTTKRGAA
ncbi:MAG: hypothetical protein FD129_1669 [bacterium]|nr:MAG: hypothetical protein FD129_1669 [bacterium]